jgi:hypothetical protein
VTIEDPRISGISDGSKRKVTAVKMCPLHLIFTISAGFVAIFKRLEDFEFKLMSLIKIQTSSDILFIHLISEDEDGVHVSLHDSGI